MHPAEIESWGDVGEKGDAADALLDGQKSIKYSKADMVGPKCSTVHCFRAGRTGNAPLPQLSLWPLPNAGIADYLLSLPNCCMWGRLYGYV